MNTADNDHTVNTVDNAGTADRANTVTVAPFGETAILLTLPHPGSPTTLAVQLAANPETTRLFTDVIPGANTVLLVLANPDQMSTALNAAARLTALQATNLTPPTTGEVIRVPVTYDGEDLPALADRAGVSIDQLVAEHCRVTWTVDFLGFAPGFPYLSSPATLFNVPRLNTPRTVVPAGAVGVAGGQTCLYPSASPGGWNLIGHTTVTLFDPANIIKPALLTAGDRVRFYPANLGHGAAS